MVDSAIDSERGPSSSDLQRFIAALDELKHAGCMVLVTGTVDETVRAATSRRLFGTSQLPRQRVVVVTDDVPLQPTSYLPNGINPDCTDVRLCGWGNFPRRSARLQDSRLSGTGHPELAAYSRHLKKVLAETEPSSVGPPGAFRVGVLTLLDIVAQYGQKETVDFFDQLSQQVRSYCGLGHCHLPLPSDSTVTTSFVDTVDIHIHLRDREGHPPEQHWHLCGFDHRSGWIPIEPSQSSAY